MTRLQRLAEDWIRSSPDDCRSDVGRLGLNAAAKYNLQLMRDRQLCGEEEWDEMLADEHEGRVAIYWALVKLMEGE